MTNLDRNAVSACPCGMPADAARGGCCPDEAMPSACGAASGLALCDCEAQPAAPVAAALFASHGDPSREAAPAKSVRLADPSDTARPHVAQTAEESLSRDRAHTRAGLGVWRA